MTRKDSRRRSSTSRSTGSNDTNALIRHHIEEAIVHLGMVKQNLPETSAGARTVDHITKIGKYLKAVYVRYGGHPDA